MLQSQSSAFSRPLHAGGGKLHKMVGEIRTVPPTSSCSVNRVNCVGHSNPHKAIGGQESLHGLKRFNWIRDMFNNVIGGYDVKFWFGTIFFRKGFQCSAKNIQTLLLCNIRSEFVGFDSLFKRSQFLCYSQEK